jgi:hypothetical protein
MSDDFFDHVGESQQLPGDATEELIAGLEAAVDRTCLRYVICALAAICSHKGDRSGDEAEAKAWKEDSDTLQDIAGKLNSPDDEEEEAPRRGPLMVYSGRP